MQTVEDVFIPLIGQLVWSVHKGYESFLTMEFDEPRLYVREPIVASPGSSQKIQLSLARRRVTIVGQWHFWIQCSEWKIVTRNYAVTSREIESESIDACLNELDGQSLLTATSGSSLNSCILGFDLARRQGVYVTVVGGSTGRHSMEPPRSGRKCCCLSH